ncbi:MAG: hypothetical protein OEU92_30915, partial [Alphaproteobacteria bacterium]|nr:hypothetical protein [Alphaproteobacteria bacterium]
WWFLTQHELFVIATNYADAIQYWDLTTSSAFADLSADAPRAKYAATVKSFAMVGHTDDPTYAKQPYRIWWSAVGDPTNWPDPTSDAATTVLSDFRDLNANHGHITGLVSSLNAADAAVFQQRGITRLIESGDDLVFASDEVEGVRGTAAPRSICQYGGLVYYLGEDGFYMFNGAQSLPIGASKVDREFFSLLDEASLYRVVSGADPRRKRIHWAFPSTTANAGQPDLMIVYNWETGDWTLSDGIEIQEFSRTLSPGWTLEDFDAVYASLEVIPGSLDDPAWRGGKTPQLEAWNTDNKLAVFGGDTLEATLETEEAQLIPGQRSHIDTITPLIDASDVNSYAKLRDRQADVEAKTSEDALDASGHSLIDRAARYARFGSRIPAGAEWTEAQGVSVRYEAGSHGNPAFEVAAAVSDDSLLLDDGALILTTEQGAELEFVP